MKHNVLHVGKLALTISLIGGLFSLLVFKDSVDAAISTKYIANYDIKADRDRILGIFVEIDANNKIGTVISSKRFSELKVSFAKLFVKFPQDYSYKVVYEQCSLLTTQLSTLSTSDVSYKGYLASFMNNCYKPLSDILEAVNTKYMVSPNIKVSPSSGPAPLTVTFDARTSIDPSNETIPSSNFYRYYRDTKGQDQIIGNTPVLHYTFQDDGNYIVHLTIKSSNSSKGILDGDKSVSIDVMPKTALISIYANGQKMNDNNKSKVGTLEAQKGVVFDASATVSMGGRQLMSYRREITSKEGFKFIKDGENKPDLIRVSLPDKGEYKISLQVIDNENNKTSENYTMVVSDPVASIKTSPEYGGTTSTVFSFDGSPSYSVLSSLKLYTREVYNQNGDKLETYQGKSIKQQFKKPGFYIVKLTVEDDLGQDNTDNIQVYVDSSDPIPQFTITPSDTWLYPSRFILDATVSSDLDKTNGVDELFYERIFPEDAKVKIFSNDKKNGTIGVEFNAIGKFPCKLTVKDSFGKLSELSKDIEVKSFLRPEITATPQASIWGNPIEFNVKSNLAISLYQWNFGDNNTRNIQSDTISHIYNISNVYTAKLIVSNTNGMTNEITKTIFVGEKGYPIVGYEVKDKGSKTLIQNETCTYKDKDEKIFDVPAYQVERFSDTSIESSLSVNTKGEKTNLQFYFQPEKKDISKKSSFSYKFDEVGCHYIDMTVEDTSVNKNSTTRIWFKIVNSLPKLDNLQMMFPQYGNEMGVGFNETTTNNVFTSEYDPLIVKITAVNPIDSDGFISYYKRYYFPKDDPTRYLETKITPSNVPYVFFSLPRVAGEYGFGVTMYDNDDGKKSSQDIIGNGPIVLFPPDANKPDIPLVTVKTNLSSLDVGNDITFNVISKIISDRDDFIKERTIYYDFDGDDTWDLITKKDRVNYTYPKASPIEGFRPKVQVLYRGNLGVAYGQNVIVKDSLKPRLLYTSVGNFAIFRDISLGPIANRKLCLNVKNCTPENTLTDTGVTAFSTTYDTSGKFFASLFISDAYANQAKKILPIIISEEAKASNFELLSIPEATIIDDKIDIMVGNNLNNTILFYIKTNPTDSCFGDADINEDSDGDSILDNDKDFACNTLYLHHYIPKYESISGKISYTLNGKTNSKEFSISFLDYEMILDPQYKDVYEKISQLIKTMSGPERISENQLHIRNMFKDLQNNIGDDSARMASVVSLKDFINKNSISWTKTQNDLVNSILLSLATKETTAAEGGTRYDILKADILAILPGALQTQINNLFTQFEQVQGDSKNEKSQQENRKEILQKIVKLIKSNIASDTTAIKDDQIEKNDMDTIIMPHICSIMEIYSIPSSFCSTDTLKVVPDDITVEKSNDTTKMSGNSILKTIFIIFGAFVGVFIILVGIFAVRAKIRQEKEDNQEQTVPPTT